MKFEKRHGFFFCLKFEKRKEKEKIVHDANNKLGRKGFFKIEEKRGLQTTKF